MLAELTVAQAGMFNEGLETGAMVVEAIRERMQGRAEAPQAAGFLAALGVIVGEIRAMKAPLPSVASIGTTMSYAKLDIRAAAEADDDYYCDRVGERA